METVSTTRSASGPAPRPPLAVVRSLHDICEDAKAATCRQCWPDPGTPCAASADEFPGYHVGRFEQAYRRALISAADLSVVLAAADGFTNSTLIFDETTEAPL